MPTVILQFVFLLIALDIRHAFGQKCTTIYDPAHGRVRLRARGRIAKFRCFRHYKLFGKKIIICSGDKWSLPPPICIRKGCDEIPSSGNLTVAKDQDGAVLEFKCAPPLTLLGEKLITCDGKTWSAPVPVCEYLEPEYYCDFEDENICHWEHDKQANFEWKWNSGTTPTRRTGPKYDHTLGRGGNGNYMFMESSSPMRLNDKARLLSRYYPATTGGLCFEIWYHMWGIVGYNQLGILKIYIGDMAQSDTLSQKAEFHVSGNQGDEWRIGRFPVGERKTFFRFIIEGTKLKSYLSDISVDDPKLYNCSDDDIDSNRSNQEETAIDTTEPVVQTTTMYHRPFETTEASSSLATTSTRLVKTTEELVASPTDYTDSTLRYQDSTAIDTTESSVKTTTVYHRPFENTEASSSLTTVTSLEKTTKEFAAPPTDDIDSNRSNQEETAIDTTEPVVQTTTMYHRPFETTEASSSLATTSTRLVKTTDELAASPTDFTDYTDSNQETAIDTTEPVVQTTTMYHRPFENSEASSSLATSVTLLVKTTDELAASPTDYMDITRSNQETTAINTTEAVVQNPTQNVLMIGIGVGIVISLMIVTSTIYAYHKKRRKQDLFEDKEEPIARKYLFEIYKYGKDSDVDYHFET